MASLSKYVLFLTLFMSTLMSAGNGSSCLGGKSKKVHVTRSKQATPRRSSSPRIIVPPSTPPRSAHKQEPASPFSLHVPSPSREDYSSASAKGTPERVAARRNPDPFPEISGRSARATTPAAPKTHKRPRAKVLVPERNFEIHPDTTTDHKWGTVRPTDELDFTQEYPEVTLKKIQKLVAQVSRDPELSGMPHLLEIFAWSYGFIEGSQRGYPTSRYKGYGDWYWDGPRTPKPSLEIPRDRQKELLRINNFLYDFLLQYDLDRIAPAFMLVDYHYKTCRKVTKKFPSRF